MSTRRMSATKEDKHDGGEAFAGSPNMPWCNDPRSNASATAIRATPHISTGEPEKESRLARHLDAAAADQRLKVS